MRRHGSARVARILLAWELGQGFGHLQRLLPIALELRSRGHECFLFVREVHSAHAVLKAHGMPFLPIPRLARAVEHSTRQNQPVDLVVDADFSDAPRLGLKVDIWDNILSVTKPDVLVADTSPTACLAARGTEVITVVVGNGTFVPANDGSDIALPPAILESVNTVQRARSRPPVDSLADIYSAKKMFITTLPELDKLNSQRSEETRCGPLKPLPPPTDAEPSVDYFAYLANPHDIDIILEGLAGSGLRGSVFIRDVATETVHAFRERGLTIHTSPRDLPDELSRAALLIHHAGPGTMEVAMAVGRPQLLLPIYPEQAYYAQAALRLGVAGAVSRRAPLTPKRVADAARMLARHAELKDKARAFSRTLAARGPFRGAVTIADAVEQLLAR
jgi:hypothetical protein